MKSIGILALLVWPVRIIVLAALMFVFLGGVAFMCGGVAQPPDPDKAQYGIQTYSTDGLKIPARIYFTDSIEYEGNTPVLTDYWSYDGEHYRHLASTKDKKRITEPFTIVKRERGE